MTLTAETRTKRHCTCAPGWFLADEGSGPIPDCACPVVTLFATNLYWTLPESRRAAFEGVETALCGSRTHNKDELMRRMLAIFACAMRVNGCTPWQASEKERDMLDALADARGTAGFRHQIECWADGWCGSVCAGGPVSAWLALDDLSSLLVSVEANQ